MNPHEKRYMRGQQFSSKLVQKMHAEQSPPAFEMLVKPPETLASRLMGSIAGEEDDIELHQEAANKITALEKELSESRAWLAREYQLHQSALDQLAKIEALVTHDGCGNTYARIAAEIGILKAKAAQSVKGQIRARELRNE